MWLYHSTTGSKTIGKRLERKRGQEWIFCDIYLTPFGTPNEHANSLKKIFLFYPHKVNERHFSDIQWGSKLE